MSANLLEVGLCVILSVETGLRPVSTDKIISVFLLL